MVSYQRLVIQSFIITTLVFIIGIFVGYQIDQWRTSDVVVRLQQSELDAQSYLTEQQFYEQFGSYTCEIAQSKLTDLSYRMGELGSNLVNYDKNSLFKQQDYDYLLRKYFLEEMRTYLLFLQLKEKCHLDNHLIIYFFDTEDSVSERQGRVLDVFVKKYTDSISVFSLNFKYTEDPMIESIKTYYNVTHTPTLILDGKEIIDSFVDVDTLEKTLHMIALEKKS